LDGKECDCECGMTDPDCLSGTLPVKNCNLLDEEVCSPLGRCTKPVYQPNFVAVSQPCQDLVLPGETTIVGLLGKDMRRTSDQEMARGPL
jgi:hypothetical protein